MALSLRTPASSNQAHRRRRSSSSSSSTSSVLVRIRSSPLSPLLRSPSLRRPSAASSSSTSPSNSGDDTLNGSSGSSGKLGSSSSASGAKRGSGADARAVAAAASAASTSTVVAPPPSLSTSSSSSNDDEDEGDEDEEETSSSSSSWEAWQRHFAACDEAAELAEDASDALAVAVEAEAYADAARHKRRLDSLAELDAVTKVQAALAEALREEDYAEAARLRDDGGAGLVGWWHGKEEDFSFLFSLSRFFFYFSSLFSLNPLFFSSPPPLPKTFHQRPPACDPGGHLLRIAAESGRYGGLLFRAADLAELNGWVSFDFFL